MKLNLDFQLTGIDGKPLEGGDAHHAGKLTGTAMYNDAGSSIKMMDWAMKLFNKQPIDIDDTDSEILITWLENYAKESNQQRLVAPSFTPIGIRGQIIKAIKDKKK